jgi:hypothetical protein
VSLQIGKKGVHLRNALKMSVSYPEFEGYALIPCSVACFAPHTLQLEETHSCAIAGNLQQT